MQLTVYWYVLIIQDSCPTFKNLKEDTMSVSSRVMNIIENMLKSEATLDIREMAFRTNIPKSTVQRILDSLASDGWVTQDLATQNYRISFKLLNLVNSWRVTQELTRCSHIEMNILCEKSQQTVLLLVLDGFRGICLGKVEPERTIKLVAETGKAFPLHAAACGKILLAYAPVDLQHRVVHSKLEAFTPLTIIDPERLVHEINDIRQHHRAISVEEMTFGAAEIAVPLLAQDGSLIAALSIAGPIFDVKPRLEEYKVLLFESAAKILTKLKENKGEEEDEI